MFLFIDFESLIFIHPFSYFPMSLSHILLQKWNRFNWTSGPIRVERERARILWLHKWKTVERFCFVFVAMNMSEYVQTVNYFCCVAMMSPLPFIQTWAKIRRENHEYLGTRLNTLKMETRAFFTWSYASPVFEIKTQWFKTFTRNLMKGREILHIIIFTQFQKFTIFHLFLIKNNQMLLFKSFYFYIFLHVLHKYLHIFR